MANLKQQAEALGIKVDDRWSDATIKAKIAEAESAGAGVSHEGPSKEALSGAPLADDGTKLKTEATPKAVKAGVTLDEKTLLIAKALELNIVVDEDWDENRLRGEIQIAREGRADLQVKGAIPPAEMSDPNYDQATKSDKDTVEILLERDYWQGPEGNRVSAGTKIRVSKDEARKLVSGGVGKSTVDPLA